VLRAWGFTTGSYQIPARETLDTLLASADPKRITADGSVVVVPQGYELDLGAVAKGYTGDQVTEIFRQFGLTSGIVSLGGNVQALGTKPDGSKWTVGIADPEKPDSLLGKVEVEDCAVITSGSYERYFEGEDGKRYWHILDPADGCPADNGLSSVTVIGRNGARCDALSTALFVMGTEPAKTYWQKQRSFEMILVTDDGHIFVTEGIASDFRTENGKEAEILHGGS
jgi:thiamine biosynthesis lipoprotein